jgi:hypothetical protein
MSETEDSVLTEAKEMGKACPLVGRALRNAAYDAAAMIGYDAPETLRLFDMEMGQRAYIGSFVSNSKPVESPQEYEGIVVSRLGTVGQPSKGPRALGACSR